MFGFAEDAGSVGVLASSISDDSVALEVAGRVQFLSSGLATIAAGTKQTEVNPDVQVTATSKILCTLLADPGSSRLLYAQPGANAFTIHMTQNVVGNVQVAWFVID